MLTYVAFVTAINRNWLDYATIRIPLQLLSLCLLIVFLLNQQLIQVKQAKHKFIADRRSQTHKCYHCNQIMQLH